MDKALIAMSGIKILILTMFMGIGIVMSKGYGADFLTFFDERIHDREEVSKKSGKVIIIGSIIVIIFTVVDCILNA